MIQCKIEKKIYILTCNRSTLSLSRTTVVLCKTKVNQSIKNDIKVNQKVIKSLPISETQINEWELRMGGEEHSN